jgi:hypothetical protein
MREVCLVLTFVKSKKTKPANKRKKKQKKKLPKVGQISCVLPLYVPQAVIYQM